MPNDKICSKYTKYYIENNNLSIKSISTVKTFENFESINIQVCSHRAAISEEPKNYLNLPKPMKRKKNYFEKES